MSSLDKKKAGDAAASSDAGHDPALERRNGDGKLAPSSGAATSDQAASSGDGGLHLQNAHFGALGVEAPGSNAGETGGADGVVPPPFARGLSDDAPTPAGKSAVNSDRQTAPADDAAAPPLVDKPAPSSGGQVSQSDAFSLGTTRHFVQHGSSPSVETQQQDNAFQQDENKAPTDIELSNTTIAENAAGVVVGTLSTVDPDAGDSHSYTVSDDRFEIVDGQLKLKDGVALDHEGEPSLTISVTSTDSAGHSITESFTITVANVNEGPSDIALSNATVLENAAGAVVGMLSTVDPDAGDTHAYTVSDSRFEVVDGQLKLKDGVALDHEGEPNVTVQVTTTDAGGLSRSESFMITVENVNEGPSDIALSNATVSENAAGAVVGVLSAIDPDVGDSHTYSVSDARFEVVDGQLKLKDGVSLDHEGEPAVTVQVTATDAGGLSLSENFTITVANVNEGPSDIALSHATVSENAAGAVVGMLTTVDPDAGDTHTYSVSDGRFEVVDGQLKLKDGVALDHEGEPSVSVHVTTTDAGGLSYSESFTITVENANDAPTDIALSNASVAENVAGAVIGTLSAVDADAGDTHVYSVSDGRFEVVDGQLKLKDGVSLDREAAATVTVDVTATDTGGASLTESFAITVANVNEGPSAINLSNATVAENAAGAVVGVLSTVDPDIGDSHSYTVSDTRFEVIGGALKLKSGVRLDHEALSGSTINLTVTSTDAGGQAVAQNFVIQIENFDDTAATKTVGTASADVFLGTDKADAFDGASGNDTLSGGASNDLLWGGAGDDTLSGGVGNDGLYGGNNNDNVSGGDGDDLVDGGTGNDTLAGDAGNDTILGGDGNDTMTGGAGNDTLSGGNGNDTLKGEDGDDALDGGAGNDVVEGGAGDDTLSGGVGTDTLRGGDGSDTYRVDAGGGTDTYADGGASGVDTIVAAASNVVINLQSGFGAASGIDAISAGGFSGVSLQGGTGNDTFDFSTMTLTGIAKIDGGAGNDTITGSAGDDTIVGGAGNDTLNGSGGSDTYQIGAGAGFDKFADTGASGLDTVVATAASVAIGVQTGFGAASGIEEISSGGFANVSIIGGTGNDTLDFSGTTLTGIAKIDGGAGNDIITGSAGDDTIVGGAGNDTLNGGGGSDTYQIGVGAGFDKFTDTGASGVDTVVATAAGVAIGVQTGFGAANGIEEISSGGFANVSIVGGTGNDTLDFSATTLTGITKIDGGAGNDIISGSAGDDVIVGGVGNDTLNGGGGSDTYQIGVGAGFDKFTDTGASGVDTVVATAADVAIGVQTGFGAANGIEEISSGGFANVSVVGGTGSDTLDFSATTLSGIARIDGGAGNDIITGSAGDDVIVGGVGNDTLNGGGGSDTYQVGAGAGFDKFTDTGASGVDKVVATAAGVAIGVQTGFGPASGIEEISSGGLVNVSIVGGTGNDSFDFSATTLSGIVKIDGGAGTDTITGSAGDDTIVGGAGNDTLKGGDGSDTYQVGVGHGVDKFTDTGVSGVDRVVATAADVAIGLQTGFGPSSGVEEISGSGFANVSIVGGTGNDTLDFSATTLTGISKIDGGAGNDIITGSAGDDVIVGGAGNDTITGGGGSDTYQVGVGHGSDKFTDTGASGVDKVVATAAGVAIGLQTGFGPASGIEEINAGGFANVSIVGGTGNDTLNFSATTLTGIAKIDGGSGNDVITGSAGADAIYGGAGTDTLSGGAGNDTLVGGAGADVLAGGDGSLDTVSYEGSAAGVTVNLLTNAVSGGDAAGDTISGFENVTGSSRDDVIYGDANNNVINAGDGNDRVFSSWGLDTIDGGAGADTIDLVNFSGQGDMTVDLGQGLVYFSGYVAGADHISNFENASGASGNDTFFGSSGDNVMSGIGGNDVFHFSLNAGHDAAHGGAGIDFIHIDTAGGSAGWLEAIAGEAPILSEGDWLLQLDSGEAFLLHGSGATFDFGAMHAGVLTAADGSEMQFTEIEGLRW